jgi:hypothetical protein
MQREGVVEMVERKNGWEWALEKRYAVQAGWHRLDTIRPNLKSRWRAQS